jgi:hypothetical protein
MLTEEGEKQNMKKTNLLAILTLAATPAFLHAQTTSYSDVVGYQTTTIPVGLKALGFPLLNPNLLSGGVSSNTSDSITISGASGINSLLNATTPYYVEVTSGALEGERFDVNFATTTSDTVGINTSSPNNTELLTSGALSGSSVALRAHVTISQVQSMFSGELVGNNTQASADQIIVVDGGATRTYYLRLDKTNWRTSGVTNNQANVAIPPGKGILFKKVSSSNSLTATGTVRGNNFARNYSSGFQINAAGFPVEASPSKLGGSTNNGWFGSNTQSAADQISPIVSGAPKTYYLRSDGSSWRTTGTTNNQAAVPFLASDEAYYVKKSSAGSFLEMKP